YRQVIVDSGTVTLTAAGYAPESLFEFSRIQQTKSLGELNNTFVRYLSSFNKDSVVVDSTNTINNVSNNFLVAHNNVNLNYSTRSVNVELLPLKNQATLTERYNDANHFNSESSITNRVYESINTGSNQDSGTDKVYLSYNIGTKDTVFRSGMLTRFTTPSSLSPYTRLNVNDSKIHNIGAQAGGNPLVSDKLYKRRIERDLGEFTDDVAATYLCSWLSAGDTGDRLWVDRYYNPDAINSFADALSGTAFYDTVTAAGQQSTYVFDVSSRLTFEPNCDYAYYHIGVTDYDNHVRSLSSHDIARDKEILTHKGAPAEHAVIGSEQEIDLDGTRFARFKTDHRGDFSLTFALSARDFSVPLGYSIASNFFEDGFGVFNTDLVTPNIMIPTGNRVLLINNDFEIYDEISITENGAPVNVRGIAR
ncbi:MAG: hypothetical protein EBV86_17160, partial [Marivivens sp.]|nr:hypothetical protein [Marivivens sp.]